MLFDYISTLILDDIETTIDFFKQRYILGDDVGPSSLDRSPQSLRGSNAGQAMDLTLVHQTQSTQM